MNIFFTNTIEGLPFNVDENTLCFHQSLTSTHFCPHNLVDMQQFVSFSPPLCDEVILAYKSQSVEGQSNHLGKVILLHIELIMGQKAIIVKKDSRCKDLMSKISKNQEAGGDIFFAQLERHLCGIVRAFFPNVQSISLNKRKSQSCSKSLLWRTIDFLSANISFANVGGSFISEGYLNNKFEDYYTIKPTYSAPQKVVKDDFSCQIPHSTFCVVYENTFNTIRSFEHTTKCYWLGFSEQNSYGLFNLDHCIKTDLVFL